MPEKKNAPKKQGVHGWRAFLMVFGCGTAAALAVFGLLVGGLKVLVSSTGSGAENADGGGGPAPTWQPPDSLDVGVLDICEDTIETLPEINSPTRLDEGDNYVDTGKDEPNKEGRVISDECLWELDPMASSVDSWKFSFEYQSFITADSGKDPESLSAERFSEMTPDLRSEFGNADEEGSENVSGDSLFLYSGSDGGSRYLLARNVSSSVYVITMESDAQSVDKQTFWNEAENIVGPVDTDLDRWTPE